jgi:bacillithiol system protein YtxJ
VTEPLPRLESDAGLESLLRASLAIVFKHSTRCGLSASALIEVRQFAARHPEIPVYLLDVIADRALARTVAARLGVQHESPQALVLSHGSVAWHASHTRISQTALENATRALEPSPAEASQRLLDGASRE